MATKFIAYIDESGDDGFEFPDTPDKQGSSEWMVLSAVITPVDQDKDILGLAASIRKELKFQPKQQLHFAHLPHDKRLHVIDRLANSKLTVSNFIVNKRAIEHPEIFEAAPFRLYKYGVRLLLERISWFCRDTATPEDCECRLIFEHRKKLSYDDLRAYLQTLKGQAETDAWLKMLLNDVRIHWAAIVPELVEAAQQNQYAGLQFADCVAGGIRSALEYRHGFTEHRYAKMLKPRIYKRGSKYVSYGLKFFPKGLEASDPRGHWLRKHFG